MIVCSCSKINTGNSSIKVDESQAINVVFTFRHHATLNMCNRCELKGLRPLPPTPADSRIFGFFDFSENVYFFDFPMGFRVWQGLQSIGNGCGLQMDGFSTHFEPSQSISVDFHDFGHLGVDSDALTLFPQGPRTPRDRPEGLRTV